MICKHYHACHQYLHFLYQPWQMKHSRYLPIAQTYGEILFESIAKLLTYYPPKEEDILFDLGSGLGKLAIQIFLMSKAKEVHGIECLSDLHDVALQVAAQLRRDFPIFFEQERRLIFKQADFLEQSLLGATILIIGSPCFTQQMILSVGEKINELSSVRFLFTLRPIPNLKYLKFKKILRLECSWDTALCYVYALEKSR